MLLTRDDFEHWLFSMDDELESIAQIVPGEIVARLDYSPDSLLPLEGWILGKYATLQEIVNDRVVLDRLARYVGETFRKNLGGIWDIELADSKDAYFELPVVRREGRWTACPVSMLTAAIDRRRGNYIRQVFEGYKDS